MKNEKGGSTVTCKGNPLCLGQPDDCTAFPVEARTSFTAPKDCEISCFYLYEIEYIGGD
jgi:hypothetical protein